ncbi:MAG: TRAP transporter large permease subunit [Hyphomicrobiales bacterium]|nr:TRAP transporter large permease subunit [Hyphomicrobiales bacterium]MCP4998596.1 TRAP transporter large permease subunit [Hyphomicrobiales bacterium]
MSPVEIGALSVVAIVVLIYLGVYIPVALASVSFVTLWVVSDKSILAINFLRQTMVDSVTEYEFATIPLFTFMGLLVSKAGLGKDVYEVMNQAFRHIRGGIGMATVGANAVFAAVTGSSIASASVFTRVSVPEMLRLDYNKRFAVGVVAGSSVLGMIIPPSAMLIIYSFVAEVSVGDMFIAGIIPGIILALAYIVGIAVMGRISPRAIGGRIEDIPEDEILGWGQIFNKTAPIVALIVIVLGGIYTGWLTPVEAGAAGSLAGLVIAVLRRRMTAGSFWEALLETGHITASILFLITTASFYSRMLGYVDLPNELQTFLAEQNLNFFWIMVAYVILMLFLGTLLDTASIILIVVPLFIDVIEPMGMSLIWFGIVTVIGAEIGLLTPPLGISCFVIKATLNDDRITLKDVFLGALPFAAIMLVILIVIIRFPDLSTYLLN